MTGQTRKWKNRLLRECCNHLRLGMSHRLVRKKLVYSPGEDEDEQAVLLYWLELEHLSMIHTRLLGLSKRVYGNNLMRVVGLLEWAFVHENKSELQWVGKEDLLRCFLLSNWVLKLLWLTPILLHMFWGLQLLYKRYSSNFIVNLLGKWKESEYSQSGQLIPVGGLVYYITPPAR